MYLIPSNKVEAKNAIVVGVKYTEFEVHSKTLLEFVEENTDA
jgi:hypothetical protein